MIRSATVDDASAIAHVHVESWRSAYWGLVPDAVLDNLSVKGRAAGWRDAIEHEGAQQSFVLVASEGNGVISFVNGGLERTGDLRYTAERYAIYLLKTCQGQGRGKALFRATAATFLERGHNAMML